MSTLSMSSDEREEFLAGVHIGVLAVGRAGDAPLTTPVWYRYDDGIVEIATAASTKKVALLRESPEASLCVQREEYPPAYVTVEGAVSIESLPAGVVTDIAARYLGANGAAQYAETAEDDTLLRLQVHTWRSVDFAKLGG
ncbi:pyridoxamine 5'-phosphate oxidase family protein [Antrihabitans sp. YC3-6]|uniref:Pyridoxamine 5'-phosphate oxidase family protein n=1 Tax=Antrihabitans stalagmiti TaxID=2799499 RepID=A0A934U0N1_9NOCA|nr:pyridoxamine 5'-phosphate oxidase family protein [Antrihabitans stalagmiti]MBJ8337621.1 pyridoxamine 5'-phosphate oxidase family protein [Antrihabitans stalagmiti]